MGSLCGESPLLESVGGGCGGCDWCWALSLSSSYGAAMMCALPKIRFCSNASISRTSNIFCMGFIIDPGCQILYILAVVARSGL